LWDSLASLQFGANGWGDELARGLANTLLLSFCALPLGLIGGLLLAFAAHSRRSWLSEPATSFAGVFRGVPELLTLFIVYFGGQRILNLLSESASSAGTIEFNSFLAGSITLGLVFAAYASEVFLGILRTLDRSYLEAARARHRALAGPALHSGAGAVPPRASGPFQSLAIGPEAVGAGLGDLGWRADACWISRGVEHRRQNLFLWHRLHRLHQRHHGIRSADYALPSPPQPGSCPCLSARCRLSYLCRRHDA